MLLSATAEAVCDASGLGSLASGISPLAARVAALRRSRSQDSRRISANDGNGDSLTKPREFSWVLLGLLYHLVSASVEMKTLLYLTGRCEVARRG